MNTKIPLAELQALERTLREKRQRTETQLEGLLGRSEEECALRLNEDVFGAREEAMLEEINAEVNVALNADIHRLRKELAEIEAALRRHADATYGICAECRRTIAVDHLYRQPTAVCCESCDVNSRSQHESRVA